MSADDSTSLTPAIPGGADRAVVQVDSLSYSYPARQDVLRSVSFTIGPREIVGLVGPSGAGKSTLLMHLNGLLPERFPPQTPRPQVHVLGLPVNAANLPRIRQLVGFVFQNPDDQLFCPTVREDVAFGPLNLGLDKQTAIERVRENLARVGLADYEDRSTLQLSVGERKRVCLAGVLACQPEVLVLDEPFSNLDPRARRALLEILRAFPGSQIVATHDLELVVELCERVIVLDAGEVRAIGPSREILSSRTLVERHGLEVPYQLR